MKLTLQQIKKGKLIILLDGETIANCKRTKGGEWGVRCLDNALSRSLESLITRQGEHVDMDMFFDFVIGEQTWQRNLARVQAFNDEIKSLTTVPKTKKRK